MSPQQPDTLSPVASPPTSPVASPPTPPTLPPTSMTLVSMASMFSLPPFPGAAYPGDFPSKEYPRLPEDYANMHRVKPEDYANMHRIMQERPFSRSPTPIVSPNDPMANDCKIVDFKGEKIASFVINRKTMLCLPQAFDLFLKKLVGGLHTVYTKLKRLEIIAIVCNVEQVRILRGLGAIQPGVNRCKLLAEADFELLYKDCITSRPGRPPKRVMPFPPMSLQDLFRPHHPLGHPSPEPFRESQFSQEGGFGRPVFHSPLLPPSNPIGAGHFMALNNPAAAQAALLSRATGLPNMGTIPLPASSPESLLESYKQSYGDMLKHLQGLKDDNILAQKEECPPPNVPLLTSDLLYKTYYSRLHKNQDIEKDDGSESKENQNDENNSSVLNLSQTRSEHPDDSLKSDSDIGEPDIGASEDDMDYDDQLNINKKHYETGPILEAGTMSSKHETGPIIETGTMSSKHYETGPILETGTMSSKHYETGPLLDEGTLSSMFHMMDYIKSFINTAVNAKMEEKRLLTKKNDSAHGQQAASLQPHAAAPLPAGDKSLLWNSLLQAQEEARRAHGQRRVRPGPDGS